MKVKHLAALCLMAVTFYVLYDRIEATKRNRLRMQRIMTTTTTTTIRKTRSRTTKKKMRTTTRTTTTTKAEPTEPLIEELEAPLALSSRLLLRKQQRGHFVQHPLDERLWIEETMGSGTFLWKYLKQDDESADGMILVDISMPRRRDHFLRLEFSPKKAFSAPPGVDRPAQVEVGSHGYAESEDGPWTSGGSLTCSSGMSCLIKAARQKYPARTVHKTKGGGFLELASGVAWGEVNNDKKMRKGKYTFQFGTIKETEKELLLHDPGRDIWIRIRPAPRPRGQPALTHSEMSLSSIALAQGKQQDAMFDELPELMKYSPWTRLSKICDPEVTCLQARKRRDSDVKKNLSGPPLHVLFSVDESKKYHWLVMVFRYWFLKTQRPDSTFTRLLSADEPDGLPIKTFRVDPPHKLFKKDHYVPYNKIVSIQKWIKKFHDELPPDQIICIIDVDVILLEDISYLAVDVKRGTPMGAEGFMNFMNEDTPYDRVINRYCKGGVDIAAPLAVPYFIHKTDLLELVDKWLEKAIEIREDTQPWEKVKDWRKHSPLQLAWTAEQWAFLCSAAQARLKFDYRTDASAFSGGGVLELHEPMVHYSDWTRGIKNGEEFKWNKATKGDYALWEIPDVDPDNLCMVDKALLDSFHEARDEIYSTTKGCLTGQEFPACNPDPGPYSWQKEKSKV